MEESYEFSVDVRQIPPDVDIVYRNTTRRSSSTNLTVKFSLTHVLMHCFSVVSQDGRRVAFLGTHSADPVSSVSYLEDYTNLFEDDNRALARLLAHFSPMLSRLGIQSHFHANMVADIITQVRRIGHFSGWRRGWSEVLGTFVLSLDIKVFGHREVFLYTERYQLDMALRESERMANDNNYGMVPTAPKARELESVKVWDDEDDDLGVGDDHDQRSNNVNSNSIDKEKEEGEGESGEKKRRCRNGGGESEKCMICLEELEQFAARMPCKHLFHGPCIVKWLKQSHYCPICRFEMPTE